MARSPKSSSKEESDFELDHWKLQIPPPPVEFLIKKLHSKKKSDVDAAVNQLAEHGEKAVGPLIADLQTLEDPDPASGLLFFMHDETTRPAPAVEALARIGKPAVSVLLELFKSEQREATLLSALQALARIDDERSLAPLLDLLKQDLPASLDKPLADAIASYGWKAIPYLVELTESDDRYSADMKAVEILYKMGARSASGSIIAYIQRRMDAGPESANATDDAIRALGKFQVPAAIDVLLSMLTYELDPRIGLEPNALAAASLGRIGARRDGLPQEDRMRILTALRDSTQSPDPAVVSASIQALGRLKDAESVDQFIALFHKKEGRFSSSGSARRSAAFALGMIGDPRGIPYVLPYLVDKDTKTAEKACKAFLGFGEAGREALFTAMKAEPVHRRLYLKLIDKLNKSASIRTGDSHSSTDPTSIDFGDFNLKNSMAMKRMVNLKTGPEAGKSASKGLVPPKYPPRLAG